MLIIMYEQNYEWTKQTMFLLSVIYGSPRQHWNSSKTFKKNREKLKYSFMTILGLTESTLFDGIISRKV